MIKIFQLDDNIGLRIMINTQDGKTAIARGNGLHLAYESIGHADNPAVIMIMGLGAQLTAWPSSLCHAIARQGFRVIRFDNRDIGLSSKLNHSMAPTWHRVAAAGFLGLQLNVPYTLDDMALDTIGLLDDLNIDRAHIIGASMGGMIAQLMAIRFPDRLLSMTAMMSTSGDRRLPRAKLSLLWELLKPRPKAENMDAALTRLVRLCQAIAGTRYRDDESFLVERLKSDLNRCYCPGGVARQAAAVVASTPRRQLLAGIKTPSLVMHGTADPVLPYAHGIDLAKAIPHAKLKLIEGMGHDLPLSLVPRLSKILLDHLKGVTSLGSGIALA